MSDASPPPSKLAREAENLLLPWMHQLSGLTANFVVSRNIRGGGVFLSARAHQTFELAGCLAKSGQPLAYCSSAKDFTRDGAPVILCRSDGRLLVAVDTMTQGRTLPSTKLPIFGTGRFHNHRREPIALASFALPFNGT